MSNKSVEEYNNLNLQSIKNAATEKYTEVISETKFHVTEEESKLLLTAARKDYDFGNCTPEFIYLIGLSDGQYANKLLADLQKASN